MAVHVRKSIALIVGSVLACSSGIALADPGEQVVDCARGESIQHQIDQRNRDQALALVIRGACAENVLVNRNGVTLRGEGGMVSGTIRIVGATRIVIRNLIVTSPNGSGVIATDNAAVTIEDSFLDGSAINGIVVTNGAHATIRRTSLSGNGGQAGPDQGRGIDVSVNGSVDVRNSTISGNRSDGAGVFNNAYARLTENTITRNGRADAGEAGVQVNRGRVRAHGNIISDNTGSAALIVVNHSDYRTGVGLNDVDFPDSQFPFERIEHRVGRHVTPSATLDLLAVDAGNHSYVDLRLVHIVGSVAVGDHTMMQVRGDQIGTDRPCASVHTPSGGFFFVSGRFGLLRLRGTHVTPQPAVIGVGAPFGLRDGGTVCP